VDEVIDEQFRHCSRGNRDELLQRQAELLEDLGVGVRLLRDADGWPAVGSFVWSPTAQLSSGSALERLRVR
jgi:hypothetical protein